MIQTYFASVFTFLVVLRWFVITTATPPLEVDDYYYPTTNSSFSLPLSEYNALYDLYVSTDGDGWTWKQPYSLYGYPWNLTSYSNFIDDNYYDSSYSPFQLPSTTMITNPCSSTTPWQGIQCTSDCSNSPCHIEIIVLRERPNRYITVIHW